MGVTPISVLGGTLVVHGGLIFVHGGPICVYEGLNFICGGSIFVHGGSRFAHGGPQFHSWGATFIHGGPIFVFERPMFVQWVTFSFLGVEIFVHMGQFASLGVKGRGIFPPGGHIEPHRGVLLVLMCQWCYILHSHWSNLVLRCWAHSRLSCKVSVDRAVIHVPFSPCTAF